jgi:hypothetical protein
MSQCMSCQTADAAGFRIKMHNDCGLNLSENQAHLYGQECAVADVELHRDRRVVRAGARRWRHRRGTAAGRGGCCCAMAKVHDGVAAGALHSCARAR